MIQPATLLVLAATFKMASAQADGYGNRFRTPYFAYIVASLAVISTFTFLYVVQLILCIAAIVVTRKYRMPYLVLLSTITFDIVYSATTISRIAILNFYTRAVPRLLSPNLSAVATFFNGWSYAITFAALVAFLWGRESAFLSPSRGKSGRRNKVVNALNFVMIVALLGLGTAVSAISMSLQRGFATGALSPTRDRFEIAHRRTVIKWLQYAFRAVTLLSTANVFVTALLLFMSAKRKGLTDQITNVILFAVTPVYLILNILRMVFLVLEPSETVAILQTVLANDLLLNLFKFALVSILLFMAFFCDWDMQNRGNEGTDS